MMMMIMMFVLLSKDLQIFLSFFARPSMKE